MINDRDYEEEYELARRDINYGLITPDMDISPYSPKVQAFEIVDMFKKCLKVSDERIGGNYENSGRITNQ